VAFRFVTAHPRASCVLGSAADLDAARLSDPERMRVEVIVLSDL
jgi:hypothetical protein